MVAADLLQGFPIPGVDPQAAAAAAAKVRGLCGWHIAPSVTETVTVPIQAGRLLLPSLHVTAVSSVLVGGQVATSVWAAPFSVIHLPAWRSGFATVTLTHGYERCPHDVLAVVEQLAKGGLTVRRISQVQTGPFNTGYFSDGADPTLGLAAYMLPVVA